MDKKQDNTMLVALPKENLVPLVRETLDSGSSFILDVTGYSMRPTLNTKGDRVELVNVFMRPVRKGEIIFFERDTGDCLLHRVIRLNKDNTFTVNGDAQAWTEIVETSQVIGVVNSFNRNGKWISCDSFFYRIYSSIWMLFKPVRRVIIKIKTIVSK